MGKKKKSKGSKKHSGHKKNNNTTSQSQQSPRDIIISNIQKLIAGESIDDIHEFLRYRCEHADEFTNIELLNFLNANHETIDNWNVLQILYLITAQVPSTLYQEHQFIKTIANKIVADNILPNAIVLYLAFLDTFNIESNEKHKYIYEYFNKKPNSTQDNPLMAYFATAINFFLVEEDNDSALEQIKILSRQQNLIADFAGLFLSLFTDLPLNENIQHPHALYLSDQEQKAAQYGHPVALANYGFTFTHHTKEGCQLLNKAACFGGYQAITVLNQIDLFPETIKQNEQTLFEQGLHFLQLELKKSTIWPIEKIESLSRRYPDILKKFDCQILAFICANTIKYGFPQTSEKEEDLATIIFAFKAIRVLCYLSERINNPEVSKYISCILRQTKSLIAANKSQPILNQYLQETPDAQFIEELLLDFCLCKDKNLKQQLFAKIQRFANQTPDSIEANYIVGKTYLDDGDADSAVTFLSRLMYSPEHDGNDTMYHLLRHLVIKPYTSINKTSQDTLLTSIIESNDEQMKIKIAFLFCVYIKTKRPENNEAFNQLYQCILSKVSRKDGTDNRTLTPTTFKEFLDMLYINSTSDFKQWLAKKDIKLFFKKDPHIFIAAMPLNDIEKLIAFYDTCISKSNFYNADIAPNDSEISLYQLLLAKKFTKNEPMAQQFLDLLKALFERISLTPADRTYMESKKNKLRYSPEINNLLKAIILADFIKKNIPDLSKSIQVIKDGKDDYIIKITIGTEQEYTISPNDTPATKKGIAASEILQSLKQHQVKTAVDEITKTTETENAEVKQEENEAEEQEEEDECFDPEIVAKIDLEVEAFRQSLASNYNRNGFLGRRNVGVDPANKSRGDALNANKSRGDALSTDNQRDCFSLPHP